MAQSLRLSWCRISGLLNSNIQFSRHVHFHCDSPASQNVGIRRNRSKSTSAYCKDAPNDYSPGDQLLSTSANTPSVDRIATACHTSSCFHPLGTAQAKSISTAGVFFTDEDLHQCQEKQRNFQSHPRTSKMLRSLHCERQEVPRASSHPVPVSSQYAPQLHISLARASRRVLEDISEDCHCSDSLLPCPENLQTKQEVFQSQPSKISDLKTLPTSMSSFNNVGQPPPKRLPEDLPSPTDLSVVLCRLRDELPSFFEGHHSFGMYSDQLSFHCNLFPVHLNLKSLHSYKLTLSHFRLSSHLLLSAPRLELIKITKHADEGRVRARWRVVGVPRLALRRIERPLLEGFSTFDVSCNGLISRHQLDKVMPSDDTEVKLSLLPQILVIFGMTHYPE